jgi:ubiquinone biosynthesis protein
LRRELRAANRRSVSAMIGTGLMIAAAVVYGLDGFAPAMLGGAPLLTWLLGAAGIALILLALGRDD